MSPLAIESALRGILESAVGKRALPESLNDASELLGAIPELDSMAVAGLLTEMEDRLDIMIDDDDVDGDLFATFGSLVAFARAKVDG